MPENAARRLFARAIAATVVACALPACGGGGSNASPAAASASMLLSTNAMMFSSASGNVSARQVEVGENGYGGLFTETDTCAQKSGAPIATVMETSPGNPATYAVTPLADGTCTIAFADANGQVATVAVGIGASAGSQSGPRQ